MKFTMRSIAKFISPESDRAERRATDEFSAYWWDGTGVQEDAVRDVSSTGVYVLSGARWKRDDAVWLTLQRQSEAALQRRMTMQAKVTRVDATGAGCAFVSATDAEARAWEGLVERVVELTQVQELAGHVKTAEAIGFACQICPKGQGIRELFSTRLSNRRAQGAVEILLYAKDLVRGESDAQQLRAPEQTVERILEDGSAFEEDWLRHYWATLLARSCTADGGDNSVLPYAQVLAQLLSAHVRILAHACVRAQKAATPEGPVASEPLRCELQEIMDSTGMRELPTQQSIEQLASLELLEKPGRSRIATTDGKEYLTPSSRGLRTYAYCRRHRGTAEEFYGLETA